MRAGHGVFAGGQGAQEPLDFRRFQAGVDLDGGTASDGRGDAPADFFERGGTEFGLGDFQNFEDDFLDIAWADAGGRGLDGDGPMAERLGFEAVEVHFLRNTGIFKLLGGRELQDGGQQEALNLDVARGALPQNLLEKNALVSDVLVDDPEAIAAGGDDETVVELAERAELGKRGERIDSIPVTANRIKTPMRIGNAAIAGWTNFWRRWGLFDARRRNGNNWANKHRK